MTKEELYEQFEELVRTYIADNSDLSDEELIKTINVDYNGTLGVSGDAAKGTNITLYIPEVLVKYPDFTDGTWTQSGIEKYCKEHGITCTFKKVSNTEQSNGTIISQSREKGAKVVAGAEVTIKIAEKEVDTPTHDDIID